MRGYSDLEEEFPRKWKEMNRREIYFEIKLIGLMIDGMWMMKEIVLTPAIGYMIVIYQGEENY